MTELTPEQRTEILERHLREHGDVLAVHGHRELHRAVDLRQGAARELHVDHRPGDADDAAVLQVGGGFRDGHGSDSLGVQ